MTQSIDRGGRHLEYTFILHNIFLLITITLLLILQTSIYFHHSKGAGKKTCKRIQNLFVLINKFLTPDSISRLSINQKKVYGRDEQCRISIYPSRNHIVELLFEIHEVNPSRSTKSEAKARGYPNGKVSVVLNFRNGSYFLFVFAFLYFSLASPDGVR